MEFNFKAKVLSVADSSLMWNTRIMLSDEIVEAFKDTDKRLICNINGSQDHHCAIMSNGDGTYYIMMNKDFVKTNKINIDEELDILLKKDDSKYGMAVPDFFEELCFQDPEADQIFHNLTAGKQRTLLHIVSKIKSEQKQLEKLMIIFDYLKSVNGKLDFKELNAAFKTNRFKI
jgi:hypothetical protein